MADDTATEEWRVVEGWPDYEVSNLGRVRRARDLIVRHFANGAEFVKLKAGLILRPGTDRYGYLRVSLYRDGRQTSHTIAPMVCRAFHGPRPSRRHGVAHGNGDKHHNWSDNLRWATPKENSEDMVRHGNSMRGEKQHMARLTEEKVREIKKLLNQGVQDGEIARQFEVAHALVWFIRKGKTWKWVK